VFCLAHAGPGDGAGPGAQARGAAVRRGGLLMAPAALGGDGGLGNGVRLMGYDAGGRLVTGGSDTAIETGFEELPTFSGPPEMWTRNAFVPGVPNVQVN
jgi:hypothetical protein